MASPFHSSVCSVSASLCVHPGHYSLAPQCHLMTVLWKMNGYSHHVLLHNHNRKYPFIFQRATTSVATAQAADFANLPGEIGEIMEKLGM
jgi:hypothetical protein